MIKSLQHKFGGYLLEGNAIVQTFLSEQGKHNQGAVQFVLFGRGRSGSTLVVEMLDAHPLATCLGEILRYPTIAPIPYIQNRLSVCPTPVRGFKLLSYQVKELCSVRKQQAIRRWLMDNKATIFHLRRDNLLNHAVSNIYAARRGAYHSTDQHADKHQAILIEPDELLRWMDGSRSLLEFEMALLDGLERTDLVYERDLATPEAQTETHSRLLNALRLPTHDYRSTLKKVTPPDLRLLISNFDAIAEALRGTPYEQFLPN